MGGGRMSQLDRYNRFVLLLTVILGGFSVAQPRSASGAEAQSDWIYCTTVCPDLEEFCADRGGHELAYCEYRQCWGPNSERWYPWTVQC